MTMDNSSSSQSLCISHNHSQSQNDTCENIFLKDNSSKKSEIIRVGKNHLIPSNTKFTRLISDPKEIYTKNGQRNNNSFKRSSKRSFINQAENCKNESFDEINSLNEQTSINGNFLNAENQSIKSNSLAKFRSSSPRDPSNSNSNSHSQSSLNEYELNEDSSIFGNQPNLIEVIKSKRENYSNKFDNKPNQAIESGSNPGPLGDIEVFNNKTVF
jgi:hypothetical protein